MNYATPKQVKFLASLLLKKLSRNEIDGKILKINEQKWTLSGKNKSCIFGGCFFVDAKIIIDALLKNNYEIIEREAL